MEPEVLDEDKAALDGLESALYEHKLHGFSDGLYAIAARLAIVSAELREKRAAIKRVEAVCVEEMEQALYAGWRAKGMAETGMIPPAWENLRPQSRELYRAEAEAALALIRAALTPRPAR